MYWTIRKRTLILALVGILVLGSLPFGYAQFVRASGSITASSNWGLSFQNPGKTPIGNASESYLGQFDAYFVGDTSQKVLYLTFDAGYENGYTAKILDTLKKHNVPAAFFLVGNYIDDCPELVKRMVAEGHVVGNHTATHPDMSKIATLPAFEAELKGLEDRYQAVVGSEMPKFYRPPQGKFCEENLRHAKDLGYKTVFWSLAYVDWYVDKQPTRAQALEKLIPRAHNGAVILLHSTSKTNAEVLDELLCEWEKLGYQFLPITELGK